MTDLYIVVWMVILLLLTMPGMALALNLLLPRLTERAATRLEATPRISFVLGAVISGGVALVAAIIGAVGVPAVSGVLGVLGLGVYAMGAAGMARLFGYRIGAAIGETRFLRDTAVGGVMLALACLLPFVGWFLFFPFVLALNIGAATFALLGWMPRKQKPAQAEADPERDSRVEWASLEMG
jgi:hypothetical protein